MKHEQLTPAENAAHVQGAADFIVRLYGVRGAELIRDGYTAHTYGQDTRATFWMAHREGRQCRYECNLCGHWLRDAGAMRRHLERKHPGAKAPPEPVPAPKTPRPVAVYHRTIRGRRYKLVEVDGYPICGEGRPCQVLIVPDEDRIEYVKWIRPSELEKLLAKVVREHGEDGRGAA